MTAKTHQNMLQRTNPNRTTTALTNQSSTELNTTCDTSPRPPEQTDRTLSEHDIPYLNVTAAPCPHPTEPNPNAPNQDRRTVTMTYRNTPKLNGPNRTMTAPPKRTVTDLTLTQQDRLALTPTQRTRPNRTVPRPPEHTATNRDISNRISPRPCNLDQPNLERPNRTAP